MTLRDWLSKFLPLLLGHQVDKIEKDLEEGRVTAYWAGAVLRIDIKPGAPR